MRVDVAIAHELLRAVEPLAIEAALQAERRYLEAQGEQQRIVELELQQARYRASLAERRYAACDPDNRLIAAQLEKSWEATLQRVQACEARLDAVQRPNPAAAAPDFSVAQGSSTLLCLCESPNCGRLKRDGARQDYCVLLFLGQLL